MDLDPKGHRFMGHASSPSAPRPTVVQAPSTKPHAPPRPSLHDSSTSHPAPRSPRIQHQGTHAQTRNETPCKRGKHHAPRPPLDAQPHAPSPKRLRSSGEDNGNPPPRYPSRRAQRDSTNQRALMRGPLSQRDSTNQRPPQPATGHAEPRTVPRWPHGHPQPATEPHRPPHHGA